MKRIAILLIAAIMLTSVLVSCKNDENGKKKPLGESGLSTGSDMESRRKEAAENSGNRVNDKMKERQKDKDKDDSPSETPAGDASKEMTPSTPAPKGSTGTAGDALKGKYAKAIGTTEAANALKSALTYAKKRISRNVNTADFSFADDSSEEYKKYPLYSEGRIIIFICSFEGHEYPIAVGRETKTSEWKVLNKK